jgi:hypothetical protein
MVKMYNEPEFKVVNVALEDVLTTSLETVGQTWDSGAGSGNVSGGGPDLDELFGA